jgi:threonine/homoserine/homoserine lactone efflux protein
VSINLLVLVFTLIAVGCVVIAALAPVSRAKGRMRLAGSLSIGIAIPLGGLSQAIREGKLLPSIVGLLGGVFLVWVGLRKYQRDPEGRTPSAQIL